MTAVFSAYLLSVPEGFKGLKKVSFPAGMLVTLPTTVLFIIGHRKAFFKGIRTLAEAIKRTLTAG